MKHYRSFLMAFAFGLCFASPTFAQDAVRTAATWQVQKYDLDVTLPPDERARSITVKAVLSLKNVSADPASTLTLRVTPFAELAAIKINGAGADFSKGEEKVNASSSLQRAVIRMPPVSPGAVLTAAVDYKITLKENTALAALSPNLSQFLPLSFWYPTPNSWYFTLGADAAPVSMRVLASRGSTVLSSGTASIVDGGSEIANPRFEQKLNVQPFFITGSWESIESSGVSVFMPKGAGADGQKRAAELAALVIDARAFVTGILGKAPDAPWRIVSSRRGAGFASGGTVIVNEAVFHRPRIDSLTAMNIAEAVTKLWIGGAVTVSGEGHGVIDEGLSRFIATQFIESKFGKDVADVERLRQRNSYAAVSKRDSPLSRVSPLDDYYYPEVANKGAMIWRILAKRVGPTEFSSILRSNIQNGRLTIAGLRSSFSAQKDLLDYLFDQITDMNLLIGTPQQAGSETKAALRNTGAADVTVDVAATTVTGEKIIASTTIKAASFGEVTFKSNNRITRVEVDADKLYPQTDYSDDIAPSEGTDSDPLLYAKRFFDKQDFANAEKAARTTLRDLPRFDDLRILLGRSLLAENKNTEADREFHAVLDEKLPTSRGLAWANEGLAEIAGKSNQNDAAVKYASAAILADGDYGASLAARNLRNKLGYSSPADATVKSFFADFDKAAASNRKADVDALVVPGEVTKFAGGVSGSTEQWRTDVHQIDRIDADTVLVEANMTVKLLTRQLETGMAVYRLVRTVNGWKLSAVDIFEMR